jgi:hypothetical protein
MACIISKGRNEVCKESVGGLLGVYFINYTTSSFTTGASGEITAVPSGSILYNYYASNINKTANDFLPIFNVLNNTN